MFPAYAGMIRGWRTIAELVLVQRVFPAYAGMIRHGVTTSQARRLCVPRLRGDDPFVRDREQPQPIRGVPRLRGDDPHDMVDGVAIVRREVFPAYAGMIRSLDNSKPSDSLVFPAYAGMIRRPAMLLDYRGLVSVFPAYAGMIRSDWQRELIPASCGSVPRLRGDDPEAAVASSRPGSRCVPRLRGDDPMYADAVRWTPGPRVPRLRGDDPGPVGSAALRIATCSPPTRG